MDDLKHLYRKALVERIKALKAGRTALVAQEPTAASTIKHMGHTLKGSGGTYGFPDISKVAASVVDADQAQLLDRLDALLALVEEVAADESA